MKAEKDPKTGKWLIQYRYTDWQGNHRKSTKRGFATKREAEEWLRKFLMSKSVAVPSATRSCLRGSNYADLPCYRIAPRRSRAAAFIQFLL